MGFGSLIDRLGWDFGASVVVSWLWRWLVEFWSAMFMAVVGGGVCGCNGFWVID